jgi:hypothetical protein
MTRIRLADPQDTDLIGGYLARLLHFDRTAAIRLTGGGAVAAAYGSPPLHGSPARDNVVLTLRTVALHPDTEPFDRTVSAGQLADALGDGAIELPPALQGGPAWAGLLPPRTGWEQRGPLPIGGLIDQVEAATADFRFNALGKDRAALDTLAEHIWSRPAGHGLRLRSAHTASVMGFLGPRSGPHPATVSTHQRWIRLNAPFGVVVERTGSGARPEASAAAAETAAPGA